MCGTGVGACPRDSAGLEEVKRKHRSACKCMNIIPPDSSTKLVQTDTAALCNTTIDVAVGPSSIADTVSHWSAHHQSTSTQNLTAVLHRGTQTCNPTGFEDDEPHLHQERLRGPRQHSQEEAFELFFSLPDHPVSSEEDRDSSSSEEEPCLVPNDEDEEGIRVPSASKKPRTTYENTDAENEDEVQDGHSSWSTRQPYSVVSAPTTWDPCYSTKTLVKAIDAFRLYFDSYVINLILAETNRHAQQKNWREWQDIERTELEAFLGMLLLMSLNPIQHFYLYWSSDSFFHNREISRVMTHKRFQDILNSLHLSDITKQKKRGEDGYSKLWRVRPLIDALNQRFSAEYNPSAHQSIGESTFFFKEHLSLKHCERSYKVWCRADSETGYLVQFQVYEGKDFSCSPDVTLGEHIVLSLSKDISPGSQLYFDSFFTTARLMEKLAQRNILAAATVRPNRKNLPEEVKRNAKLQMGEYVWRSNGVVTAFRWQDDKSVHVLSNFHDPEETTEVSRKLANGSVGGMTCPKSVFDYNRWIGGVDQFDQRRNSYQSSRHSKRGWLRLFYFMLDAAAVNAFHQYQSAAHSTCSYMWFRLSLARQLINGKSFTRCRDVSIFRNNKRGKRDGQQMMGVPNEVRYLGSEHHPLQCKSRRRCRWCSTKTKEARTKYECQTCRVPLCVGCFSAFHKET